MNPTAPNPTPRLLTLLESAERLRISHSLVRQLVRRGDLPAVTIGRRVLIEPVAIEDFIKRRRSQPIRQQSAGNDG